MTAEHIEATRRLAIELTGGDEARAEFLFGLALDLALLERAGGEDAVVRVLEAARGPEPAHTLAAD